MRTSCQSYRSVINWIFQISTLISSEKFKFKEWSFRPPGEATSFRSQKRLPSIPELKSVINKFLKGGFLAVNPNLGNVIMWLLLLLLCGEILWLISVTGVFRSAPASVLSFISLSVRVSLVCPWNNKIMNQVAFIVEWMSWPLQTFMFWFVLKNCCDFLFKRISRHFISIDSSFHALSKVFWVKFHLNDSLSTNNYLLEAVMQIPAFN